MLFAAEWGDLSQLLTLSLVAKYDDPVSVFIGAWGALLAVSGLAVLVGRVLLSRMRLSHAALRRRGACAWSCSGSRCGSSLAEPTAGPLEFPHVLHRTAPTARSADSRP